MSNKVLISDYLNVEYREYANYDIERSLPGIDGFTTVRRKVLWTMFTKKINTYDKRKKISWVSNMTSALMKYSHGEASMEGSINKMVNSFTGSNNYAFLSGDGQVGNILDPSPGSARYVKVYLNKTFNQMFDLTDLELCEPLIDEGEPVEPAYLRSLLPLLVLNGASGPAFGYKTNIYSYNIEDVIRVMKAYINTGEVLEDNLVPYYHGYKGVIKKNQATKQISISGCFKKVDDSKHIINISEIPFNWTLETYKVLLNKLKISKIIKDYDDESTTASWNINIYASKEFYEKDKFIIKKILKLEKKDTETLVVNTPKEKHKCFDNIVDIIVEFCNYRIKWTEEKRTRDIFNVKTKLNLKSELLRFIQLWNDSKDIHKLANRQLKAFLSENNFSPVHVKLFLNIPVQSLTLAKINDLALEIRKLERQLVKLEKQTSNEILNNALDTFTQDKSKRLF